MATRRTRSTATTEPTVAVTEPTAEAVEPETVLVTWTRNMHGDASSEHGAHIGDRHYQGRIGQQVEMRADDAVILVANGYVKYLAQPEQVA